MAKTEWYKNGQKRSEINYKDGKLHGLKTRWYDNGQKKSELNYEDGKPHGIYTEWYENGKKKSEVYYQNGKCCIVINWGEKGQIVRFNAGDRVVISECIK